MNKQQREALDKSINKQLAEAMGRKVISPMTLYKEYNIASKKPLYIINNGDRPKVFDYTDPDIVLKNIKWLKKYDPVALLAILSDDLLDPDMIERVVALARIKAQEDE